MENKDGVTGYNRRVCHETEKCKTDIIVTFRIIVEFIPILINIVPFRNLDVIGGWRYSLR